VTANWRSLDIGSNDVFYTDSNGLGMVKRTKDEFFEKYYRNDYMKPSGNYYPVTTAIMIEDEKKEN